MPWFDRLHCAVMLAIMAFVCNGSALFALTAAQPPHQSMATISTGSMTGHASAGGGSPTDGDCLNHAVAQFLRGAPSAAPKP